MFAVREPKGTNMSKSSGNVLKHNPNYPWALEESDVYPGLGISYYGVRGKIFDAIVAEYPSENDEGIWVLPLVVDNYLGMSYSKVSLADLGIAPYNDGRWSEYTYCLATDQLLSKNFSLGAILAVTGLIGWDGNLGEAYQLLEFMLGVKRDNIQRFEDALDDCILNLYKQLPWLNDIVRPERVNESDWRKFLEDSYGATHEIRPISTNEG